MKRALILGGLLGVAGYGVYRYQTQKASFNGSVPLGNLLPPTDPFLYVSIALGAATAYALKL
jgi:hypothetical protein